MLEPHCSCKLATAVVGAKIFVGDNNEHGVALINVHLQLAHIKQIVLRIQMRVLVCQRV